MGGAVVWVSLCVTGCAFLPPPAAGPSPQHQLSSSLAWAAEYAPERWRIQDRSNNVVHRLDSGRFLGHTVPGSLLFPRLALRIAVSDRTDFGFHVGGVDVGADVRRVVVDPDGHALAITMAAQIGHEAVLDDKMPGRTWDARLSVERHTKLGRSQTLIWGLGLSLGERRHAIIIPGREPGGEYPAPRLPDLFARRSELRLEGACAFYLGRGRAFISIGVAPYYVLRAGDIKAGGAAFDVLALDRRWGIVFTLAPIVRTGRKL